MISLLIPLMLLDCPNVNTDDPTGTQSVADIPVLADWSVDALKAELRDTTSPGFFLLSNVR